MPTYHVKQIKYKIRKGGGTMISSSGVSFARTPRSEYEAQKMAEDWIMKKHPGCTILELEVIFG